MDTDALVLMAEFSREVAVLQWPTEREQRDALARHELPRLLVLDGDADPPVPSRCCLEDWVRMPIGAEDLRVRLATLAARGEHHRPVLDAARAAGPLFTPTRSCAD